MKENYKIIKGLIDKNVCLAMARRLEQLLVNDIYRPPDSQCKLSPAFYGVFNDELEHYRSAIENAIDAKLYPVYTYSRIYQEGEYLLPHFDRPGAELSLTVTLDYDKFIWPIWFQDDNGAFQEVILDIGDALIYKGSLISHFRHPMHGQDFQHQTFFHYVYADGPFNHLKYDERTKLLSNKESELWNFPDWSDDKFRQDPNYIINRIASKKENL